MSIHQEASTTPQDWRRFDITSILPSGSAEHGSREERPDRSIVRTIQRARWMFVGLPLPCKNPVQYLMQNAEPVAQP